MRRAALAVAVSLAVHAGLAAGLMLAVRPEPVPPPEGVEARLRMASEPVRRSEARPADAAGARATEAEGGAASLGAAPVRRERAEALDGADLARRAGPVAPDAATAAALPPPGTRTGPTPPPRAVAEAAAAVTRPAVAQDPEAGRLAAVQPSGAAVTAPVSPAGSLLASSSGATVSAPAASPADAALRLAADSEAAPALDASPAPSVGLAQAEAEAPTLAGAAPEARALAGAAPEARALAGAVAGAERVAVLAAPSGQRALPRATDAAIAPAATPTADAAPARPARGASAEARAPDAERAAGLAAAGLARAAASRPAGDLATAATAGLAWSGDAETRFDALSLATVQSFMAPRRADESGLHGGDARDGIAAALAGFPCSRLQAAFVPETGALEIRGHVPDPELGRAVEARLSSMIGAAIPVGGNIALLPAPQCEVLGAIEALGLPQSTDQADDPLVVGQAAQARVFAIAGGNPFAIDLGGADYPAHVYVDYYDSEGMVLHLVPNEHVPLRRLEVEEPYRIGAGNPDFSGLALTVEPPFGRDIAVAIAVSEPLYEGVRPIVEPADPYLDWLRGRIAEARRRPGFRGEWVYFFVDTRPPG